jgi:hypothetical protein
MTGPLKRAVTKKDKLIAYPFLFIEVLLLILTQVRNDHTRVIILIKNKRGVGHVGVGSKAHH